MATAASDSEGKACVMAMNFLKIISMYDCAWNPTDLFWKLK
jgi:hypothetical protein